MESATLHAFDRAAPSYAQRWDDRAEVRWLRARVHAAALAHIARGGRVADLGCGVGTDARVLAASGFSVTAFDGSAGMVARARERGVDARVVPWEGLAAALVGGGYDGALSNFGAVDCASSPALVRDALLAGLRPGGVALLVTMSPLCLAETAHLVGTGRPRAALRRRRSGVLPLQGGSAAVWFRSVPTLVAGLAPLELVSVEALGAVFAPPDLAAASPRRLALDALVGRWPVVRRLGDHTLTVWRRP